MKKSLVALSIVSAIAACSFSIAQANDLSTHQIVIAHRGASGYLPEHTLEAKALAFQQGADYLEQDVVMTKDNVLVVMHDIFLDRITNVMDVYPDRHRADGHYYAIDFTWPELQNLQFTEEFKLENGKKVATRPNRFPIMTSDFKLHTLESELQFIQGLNHSTGKHVGIYVEVKKPWFYEHEGKDITLSTLKMLKQYGYDTPASPAYLQCFDQHELERVKQTLFPELGMKLKTVFLIANNSDDETYVEQKDKTLTPYDYSWVFKAGAMEKIKQFADGIGPDYHMLFASNATLNHVSFTPMVQEAHKNHLFVHPYTVRADQLPPYVSNVNELYNDLYVKEHVDGLFTDFPDLAAKFLRDHNSTH